jgi:hypothetical protein
LSLITIAAALVGGLILIVALSFSFPTGAQDAAGGGGVFGHGDRTSLPTSSGGDTPHKRCRDRRSASP